MTAYANTCAFCQRNDSPPTREDILANWIAQAFPDVLEFKIVEDRANRSFNATGKLGIVSRKVCERCNTGWMSRLESAAKPILMPMMQGQAVSLTQDEQLTICQWFLKTAMMLERRGEGPYFFTDEDRRMFADTQQIPEGEISFNIFLARYVGNDSVRALDWIVPLQINPNSSSPIPVNGYTATLIIKQFAVQFFAARWPPDVHRGGNLRIKGEWDIATVKVWPITADQTWPPAKAFDDTVIDLFIERLGKAEA